MKQVIHNGYVITVSANNDRDLWRAHAIIIWDKGNFELHDEARFPTQVEGENHAVESGKHWVNNHLQKMQG